MVLAFSPKPRILRIVVVFGCITSRSSHRIFAIGPVVDQFHQAAKSFRLQASKLFLKIAPEEAALEGVDDQLMIHVLARVLDLGPSLDVIS